MHVVSPLCERAPRRGFAAVTMFSSEKNPAVPRSRSILGAFYWFSMLPFFFFPSCLHCLINTAGSDERKNDFFLFLSQGGHIPCALIDEESGSLSCLVYFFFFFYIIGSLLIAP